MAKLRGSERLEALSRFDGMAPLVACAAGLSAAGAKRGGLRLAKGLGASNTEKSIQALRVRLADLADGIEDSCAAYMRALRQPGFIAPQRVQRDARVAEIAKSLCTLWFAAADLCAESVALLDAAYDPDRYDAAGTATGASLCAGAAVGCHCAAGEYIDRMNPADAAAFREQLQAVAGEGACARWIAQHKSEQAKVDDNEL